MKNSLPLKMGAGSFLLPPPASFLATLRLPILSQNIGHIASNRTPRTKAARAMSLFLAALSSRFFSSLVRVRQTNISLGSSAFGLPLLRLSPGKLLLLSILFA